MQKRGKKSKPETRHKTPQADMHTATEAFQAGCGFLHLRGQKTGRPACKAWEDPRIASRNLQDSGANLPSSAPGLPQVMLRQEFNAGGGEGGVKRQVVHVSTSWRAAGETDTHAQPGRRRTRTKRREDLHYPPNGVTRFMCAVRLVADVSQAVMAANCCPEWTA